MGSRDLGILWRLPDSKNTTTRPKLVPPPLYLPLPLDPFHSPCWHIYWFGLAHIHDVLCFHFSRFQLFNAFFLLIMLCPPPPLLLICTLFIIKLRFIIHIYDSFSWTTTYNIPVYTLISVIVVPSLASWSRGRICIICTISIRRSIAHAHALFLGQLCITSIYISRFRAWICDCNHA